YSDGKISQSKSLRAVEAMKDALMEYETIDADQVDDLMNRVKVRPPKQWDDNDFDNKSGGSGQAHKEAEAKQDSQDGESIGGPVEDI
ncbi:MAG: hypothetical protein ACPH64_05250, partial [Porticoccaceae bacterium]